MTYSIYIPKNTNIYYKKGDSINLIIISEDRNNQLELSGFIYDIVNIKDIKYYIILYKKNKILIVRDDNKQITYQELKLFDMRRKNIIKLL